MTSRGFIANQDKKGQEREVGRDHGKTESGDGAFYDQYEMIGQH